MVQNYEQMRARCSEQRRGHLKRRVLLTDRLSVRLKALERALQMIVLRGRKRV
jgi:hypothetical protein